MRRRRSFRRIARGARARSWRALAVALGVCAAACGHPATPQECEEIIERIARLELEKRYPNDPDGVARQIDEMKAQLRETTGKDCVGKRITESAMRCVRDAKTSQEIVEQCFD